MSKVEAMWLPIEITDGALEVSNTGLIRDANTGKIRSLCKDYRGCMHTVFTKDGKRTPIYPHREVANLFVENPYNKKTVTWLDSNKENNDSSNIVWGRAKASK